MGNLKKILQEMKVRMEAELKNYDDAELQTLLEKATENEDSFFSLNEWLVATKAIEDEIANRRRRFTD